jgi:hypothetical protein
MARWFGDREGCPLTFPLTFSLIRLPMRSFVPLVLMICFATGCQSRRPGEEQAPPRGERTVTATTLPAPGERPVIRPTEAVRGRVIAVRDNLRFVVIDFGAGPMPKMDQRLWAYRLDQKVAELKVSGPYLGTTVAADITVGETREGDLVRTE